MILLRASLARVGLGLCLATAGCPMGAGPAGTSGQPPMAQAPGATRNLGNLLRGGRFAELAVRISEAQAEAEKESPEAVGLLLAARGRVTEGLRLLAKARTDTSGMCLPLLIAQIHLYQRGDAQAALSALGQPGGAGCAGEAAQTISALRARLVPLLGAPVLEVQAPAGEQKLTVDRIAASAGYLVARVIFDRDRSGLFLLGTGFPDVVLDQKLAAALRLRSQEERRTPAGELGAWPGLLGAELPSATVPQMRTGLLNLRNVPVLVADLGPLSDLFRRFISREVRIDGLMPLQRLSHMGYLRLRQRGTEVRVAQSSIGAGPCRLQHRQQMGLYQIGGVLFAEAGLAGSPPLLMRLALEERRTMLRHSALKYAAEAPKSEPAQSDVSRPPITEPVAKERLAALHLFLGEAQLGLHHVPLFASTTAAARPVDHGTLGGDIPAELDLMLDMGESTLYVAPHDRVSCD